MGEMVSLCFRLLIYISLSLLDESALTLLTSFFYILFVPVKTPKTLPSFTRVYSHRKVPPSLRGVLQHRQPHAQEAIFLLIFLILAT